MTKYILHGGYIKRDTEDNKKFFQELGKDLSDESQILFVPFAREKDVWDEFISGTELKLNSVVPGKDFKFIMAKEDAKAFAQQIQESDAVLMIGGDTHKLLDFLKQIQDLEKLWEGKIVVGSSAGAQVLSKYFYCNDTTGYYEGLGFLNIKVFVHWFEDKKDELRKLEEFGEKLEVLKIPEEKFVTIIK